MTDARECIVIREPFSLLWSQVLYSWIMCDSARIPKNRLPLAKRYALAKLEGSHACDPLERGGEVVGVLVSDLIRHVDNSARSVAQQALGHLVALRHDVVFEGVPG